MRRLSSLALATLSLLPLPLLAQSSGSTERAVNSINPEDIYRHISVLADDSMLGRDTPSQELDEVAAYIAGHFRRIALTPGGDEGTYLQRYPILVERTDPERSVISVGGGPSWRFGTDFGHILGRGEGEFRGSPVVVSGTPGAASDFARLPIEGEITLVVVPVGTNGNFARSARRLLTGVLQRRPAAVIAISARGDAIWRRELASQLGATRVSVGFRHRNRGTMPLLELRDETIGPVLAEYGFDLAAARESMSQPIAATSLPALELTISLKQQVLRRSSAPNVVGILVGSDPVLRDEHLVFSAHMDHIGVGRANAEGDSINNGADDDASGTAGIMELAEAFAMLDPAPKRSLIFLTVSGEEKGLWGSEFFATQPPVPIDQIVANLNADMIGRNWTDTIVVIGREHSDLGVTLDRVNQRHPELNMTAIDDLWPEERFYFRSDHYNFARRGVPILFFFNGTHEDYHQRTDEVGKIDAEKESRVVRLLFYLGLEVANARERPRWDPDSHDQIVRPQRP